jgi:hypothetical protein
VCLLLRACACVGRGTRNREKRMASHRRVDEMRYDEEWGPRDERESEESSRVVLLYTVCDIVSI